MLLAKPIGEVSDMTRHETSQTLVCVYRRRLCIRRKYIMTIKLKDKLFTEEEIIKCLATCESVISLYYVEGSLIKNIKAENLAKIMGPIYYR